MQSARPSEHLRLPQSATSVVFEQVGRLLEANALATTHTRWLPCPLLSRGIERLLVVRQLALWPPFALPAPERRASLPFIPRARSLRCIHEAAAGVVIHLLQRCLQSLPRSLGEARCARSQQLARRLEHVRVVRVQLRQRTNRLQRFVVPQTLLLKGPPQLFCQGGEEAGIKKLGPRQGRRDLDQLAGANVAILESLLESGGDARHLPQGLHLLERHSPLNRWRGCRLFFGAAV
mmetsp:Transcript_33596/g.96383  ORF Transcript_33596/g.96383 Transcript_33596/m.96383 type:complete len:234 (-) Transcript_33596:303-1004(-)